MQRPNWLSGWGTGKSIFKGSLIVDIPEIRVAEASLNEKLVFFAIGTAQNLETTISDEGNAEENESKSRTDLKWKIFYDPTALPNFMPVDKAKDFMAGTVAMASGNASVYDKGTKYIVSGGKHSKGNAPLLLDYELAKKIEEERNKKLT